MAATAIDDLFIKITSSSENAETTLSNLASSLDKLAGSLTKIGSGADGVKALNRLKSALSGLSSINGLDSVSSSIDKIAGSLNKVNGESAASIRTMMGNLGKLSSVDSTTFTNVADGITQMGEAINRLDAEKLRVFSEAASHLGSLKTFQDMASGMDKMSQSAESTSTALMVVSQRAEVAASTLSQMGNTNLSSEFVIDGEFRNLDNLKEKLEGFVNIANRVKNALNDAFKNLYTVNPSILGDNQKYTDEYLRLQKAIQGASNEIYKLSDRAAKMNELGATDDAWERLAYDIEQATEKLKGYYSLMSDLQRTGGDVRDMTPKELKQSGNSLGDVARQTISLAALASAIRKASNAMDGLANAGQRVLSKVFTPWRVITSGMISQVGKLGSAFTGLAKRVVGSFTNMLSSWKKIFERFRFTLLRRAINAIIKDLNAAMLSLANFSESTGAAFNKAVSSVVADSKYLGASLVAAFAPIVDSIAPMIDFLVDKLVGAINIINQFFAALGGQSSFVVAKKGTADFASGLDKAGKSAKKLKNNLLGIDELNIFQPKTDTETGAGSGSGYEYAWEQLEVSNKIADFADKVKKVLADLFEPLKKAWDNAGKYVTNGFSHMKDRIVSLFKTIGKDFLEVWNQKATVKMFENILKIIGNIMKAVGKLAGQFEKAWKKNDAGRRILEKIRDIMAILVEHAKNVSDYIVKWAGQINFSPLLESFDRLLASLKGVADFFGRLFEDVMQNVVLKFAQWMIEVGVPKIQDAFASVFSKFNGDKILEALKPLEDAIENVGESLVSGFAGSIEIVGSEIARWANSDAFSKFTEGISNILNEITPERVEKVLGGIGLAFTGIVEAIADFISSDFVQNFVSMIGDWIDSLTAEDIAGILTNIAKAIAGFKFASFVGKGVTSFLNFFNAITTFKGFSSAASKVASGGGALASISSAAGTIGGIAIAIGAAAGVMTAFGALNAIPGFKEFMQGGGELLATMFKQLGNIVGSLVGGLVEGVFSGLPAVGESLAQFGRNIEPFFETISSAPVDGVSRFVGALALLMGGIAANNFSTNLFGGMDLANIGQQLSVFVDGARNFFIKVADLPEEGLNKASKVFQAISGMGQYDFKTGGLFQAFTGHTNMTSMGAQLASFAEFARVFFEKVAGYPEEGIAKAPKVFEAISGMGQYDFKTGGVFQFFTGHTDMNNMGVQLAAFGNLAKPFFDKVAGYPDKGLEKAPVVFKAISGMGQYDFKNGGVFQLFTGHTDMISTGAQLAAFGKLAEKFFVAVANYPDAGLQKAPQVFKAISGMGQYDFKNGGLFQLFTGFTDMNYVGTQLAVFGKFAGKFFTSVSLYPDSGIEKAQKVFQAISLMSSYDFKTGGLFQIFTGSNDFITLGAQLLNFAGLIAPFYAKMDTISESGITKGTKVLSSISSLSDMKEGGLLGWIAKGDKLTKAGEQLSNFGGSASSYYSAVEKLSTNAFKNGRMAIEVLMGIPVATSGNFLAMLMSTDIRTTIDALYVMGTPIQTFFSAVSRIPQEAFTKAKQMFAIFSTANVNFVQLTSGMSGFVDLLQKMGQMFVSIANTPEGFIRSLVTLTETITRNAQATIQFAGAFPRLSSAINTASTAPTKMSSSLARLKSSLIEVYNTMVRLINLTNKFKSTMNGVSSIRVSGSGIRGYATGGFPEDGLFFANHSELVGQFSNGQTAVANNTQIIAGIESGVERAMSRALSGMGGGSQVLTVELDGREIYRSVVAQNNSTIQRTGTSPLLA